MNAKRKTKQAAPEPVEPALQAAEGEGLPPVADAPGGVREYDPAKPHERPGQAPERDDQLDAQYRAAQGGTLEGDAINGQGEPGAGDPQNGVLTPEGKSAVTWAHPTCDVAQHYEASEDAHGQQAAQTHAPVDPNPV